MNFLDSKEHQRSLQQNTNATTTTKSKAATKSKSATKSKAPTKSKATATKSNAPTKSKAPATKSKAPTKSKATATKSKAPTKSKATATKSKSTATKSKAMATRDEMNVILSKGKRNHKSLASELPRDPKYDVVVLDPETSNDSVKIAKFKEDIIKAQGHQLCKSETGEKIGERYFRHAVDEARYVFMVFEKRTLRTRTIYNIEQLQGFALIKQIDNGLYLDLICGSGTGSRIFKRLDEFAISKGVTTIVLSAVPTAMILYYSRYGFKFTNTCNQNEDVKDIANNATSQIKNLKVMQQSTTTMPFHRALKRRDRILKPLKSLLLEKGLVSNKACTNITNPFKQRRCANSSGYTMTKCLS